MRALTEIFLENDPEYLLSTIVFFNVGNRSSSIVVTYSKESIQDSLDEITKQYVIDPRGHFTEY
jgi:hypothetical protein